MSKVNYFVFNQDASTYSDYHAGYQTGNFLKVKQVIPEVQPVLEIDESSYHNFLHIKFSEESKNLANSSVSIDETDSEAQQSSTADSEIELLYKQNSGNLSTNDYYANRSAESIINESIKK